MKLVPHQKSLKAFLRTPANKKAYNDLELEFAIIDALIRARGRKGVTQEQLARKIGTKQSAIARFESGKSNPTLSFVQKLSDALGIEVRITVRQTAHD